MASYTMQLRAYIEHFTQYEEGLTLDERIEEGRKHLFDFDYPFFDEAYRKAFETKFIRNFYMREIGFETESLFKMRLQNWLDLNMPYYNKMFESELIEFDPLHNTELDTTRNVETNTKQNDSRNTSQEGSTTGNSESESNTQDEGFNRSLRSDTPDDRLAISTNDGEGIIEYASEIGENKSTGNQSASDNTTASSESQSNLDDEFESNINNLEDYISHRTGKIGVQSYSKLLMEFRETFLRLEKQIFNEMNELFMGVY